MFDFLKKKKEIEFGECPKLRIKRLDEGFEVSFWDAHWSSPVVITKTDVGEILSVIAARRGSYKMDDRMELEFLYGGLMREDRELFVAIVDGHNLMLRLSAADEKRLRKFLSK